MVIKFNLITAVCDDMGIGKNNNLPWRLKTEMEYFTRMTSETQDESKKNVVIMGRKTWESIPKKFKPLNGRINFVLSRSEVADLSQFNDVYGFNSLGKIVEKLEDDELKNLYENVWVIGGSQIYKEAMNSKHFHRLYLTTIFKSFDCDIFFPKIETNLKKISDPKVPEEIQEENGIKFQYNIYQNLAFKE